MAETRPQRVLVMVWEGADPAVVRQLCRRGQLPALTRLTQGAMGPVPIGTHLPWCKTAMWTSAWTGRRADQHGLLSTRVPDASGIDLRDSGPADRRGLALWNILTLTNRPSLVIGMPGTHPAESIDGLMITDRYPGPYRAGGHWGRLPAGTVHATSADAAAAITDLRITASDLRPDMIEPFVPQWGAIDQARDRRLAAVCHHLAHTASVHAAATWAIAALPWHFAAIHYPLVDALAPMFHPAAPPYEHVMSAAYTFYDLMLARLMQLAGAQALIIVVSGHCRRCTPGAKQAGIHPLGMLAMGGDGAGLSTEGLMCGSRLLDLVPTVLAALGIDATVDMPGRAWHEAFGPVLAPARRITWELAPGRTGRPAPEPDTAAQRQRAAAMLARLHHAGLDDPLAHDLAQSGHQAALERAINTAYACEEGGDLRQTMAAWQTAIKLDPHTPTFGLEAIRCLWRDGREQNAADLARQLLTKYAQKPEADTCSRRAGFGDGVSRAAQFDALRALVAWNEGDRKAAVAHLASAAAYTTQHAGWLCLLGDGYARIKHPDEARQMYHRAVAADPGSHQAHLRLVGALLAAGDAPAAAEAAFIAAQLDATSLPAHELLVQALAAAGMPEEAAQIRQRRPALTPSAR